MTWSQPLPASRPQLVISVATPAKAVEPDAASMAICRQALSLARTLQEAGPEPVERKRRLLAGLCEMVGARQAMLAITRTDLQTGVHDIQGVVAIRMTPLETPARRGDASDANRRRQKLLRRSRSDAAPATAVDVSAEAAQEEANGGRCVDDFVWLDGLKLIGSVLFTRPVGALRFSPRDRALIEIVHKQFAWVYSHDRWLAAVLPELDAPSQFVLQDLVAGHDPSAIATRRRLRSTVVRTTIDALWNRLGIRSRDELIAKWAQPFTP